MGKRNNLKYFFIEIYVIFQYASILLAVPINQQDPISNQQITLQGKVVDANTKEPLANANVFLSNTTFGNASDKNGFFSIINIPLGSYELVFSMAGYEMGIRNIELVESKDKVYNMALKQKPYQAPKITITAADPIEWKRNLKRFKEAFLGASLNAKKCVIINQEILDFNYRPEDSSLLAKASAPLKIMNYALGYEIEFHLLEFTSFTSGAVRYSGKSIFKNIEPRNKKEKLKWSKNRKLAYKGSYQHFLRTLMKKSLSEEGYFLFTIKKLTKPNNHFRITGNSILNETDSLHEKELKFDNYLKVIYRRTYPQEISFLEMDKDLLLIINTAGQMNNPFTIIKYGQWAADRFGESMPLDYMAESTN